jgi:hypothetical protein
VQTIREFERHLADAQRDVQRLERENENLEGQVEQLTISLMDATSKKTDSELRLRQQQQVRACLPSTCSCTVTGPDRCRAWIGRHLRPDGFAIA